jgi:protein arginine N-methyltransferase 1
MIRDRVRMDAYTEALRRSVKPGDVVIDIGTGTGIFALIACQLGAKHVYAFEPNPLIEVGKQIAAANGFADRITFIKDFTTAVTPPEQADVIVGDIRGQLPFLYPNISTYHDAYHRLLKPGGILIPKRDKLFAAFYEATDEYRDVLLTPWVHNPYNLDMSAALPMILNAGWSAGLSQEKVNIVLPGQQLDTLEYGLRSDPRSASIVEWEVEQAGTAHFLYIWFDAELIEGVTYSAAPGVSDRPVVYGSSQYPLLEPLSLQPGQIVRLSFNADLLSENYIYRWKTELFANAADKAADKALKRFNQSTFFARPLDGIHKRSPSFTPTLGKDGKLQAFIFSRMAEGNLTLQQIAASALSTFPDSGRDQTSMLSLVASLSQSFSQ